MISLAAILAFANAHSTILLYVVLAMVNAMPMPGTGFRFYDWFYAVSHSLANRSAAAGQVVPVTTTTTMQPQAVTSRAVVTPVDESEQLHVSAPGA
jgi:hypothetical protein